MVRNAKCPTGGVGCNSRHQTEEFRPIEFFAAKAAAAPDGSPLPPTAAQVSI